MPSANEVKVSLCRMRYGVGLVFQGDRKRPYGFVMSLKLRASDMTGVKAQRPLSTTCSADAGEL